VKGSSLQKSARESRGFTRNNDKPRNDHHVNIVEYGSESLDDEQANRCVVEWSWASKSKSLVCSGLKPISKNWQYEMRFTFDAAKRDRIFDYLLQKKQIKL
jgi:hypothetical protein